MTGFICLGYNQDRMLCFVMLDILKQISTVIVIFFFFLTKALTPQSQLSQLKAISFLFLTRQTSINLKSFHSKHTAAVHYPGCHLRSLPYMACSFSFPGLPFCFYSHKTDLQNFLSLTASLPSYPRRVCHY